MYVLSKLVLHYLRNSSLEDEVVALRRKEKEDTRALEDMVQRVESNLVATTVSTHTHTHTHTHTRQVDIDLS